MSTQYQYLNENYTRRTNKICYGVSFMLFLCLLGAMAYTGYMFFEVKDFSTTEGVECQLTNINPMKKPFYDTNKIHQYMCHNDTYYSYDLPCNTTGCISEMFYSCYDLQNVVANNTESCDEAKMIYVGVFGGSIGLVFVASFFFLFFKCCC